MNNSEITPFPISTTFATAPYGRPQTFFFDRGTDFDNDYVREINGAFDIVCEYEPVGCPNYKGKLERWQRTMAEQVAHPLPGATPPRDKDGDFRRDSEGRAYITLSDFIRRLWRWIMTVYMHSPHRGIRTTPHLKWIEGASCGFRVLCRRRMN